MWDTFKLQVKSVMESGPSSLDDVAKIIATAYDNTMKAPPAGDIMFKNPVEQGNVALLENMIKLTFIQQQSSPVQLPVINFIANGFIGYWSGATLQRLFTPLIPAPGSISNILITQNMVSVPGIQIGIPFTYEGLDNVDGFLNKLILAANLHLSTIQGFTLTTSTYPPLGTPGPGFLPWSGFSVDSNPIDFGPDYQQMIADNEEINKLLKERFGDAFADAKDLAAKGKLIEDLAKQSAAPPIGTSAFDSSGELDVNSLSGSYLDIASSYISQKEGFIAAATWDVNHLRLGFGSDKIYKNGLIKEVKAGDITTREDARIMLKYELENDYKKRIIRQIGVENWNKQTDKQKAALISFTYNVGSLKSSMVNAIKTGDNASVSQLIASGPITGGGVMNPGLVNRRKEKARLYGE